jgi:hypothetical protein
MWDPRRLTTLWAFMACYGITFLLLIYILKGVTIQDVSLSSISFLIHYLLQPFDPILPKLLTVLLNKRQTVQVINSNLGRNTGYPDRLFLVFLGPTASFQILSNSSFITHPTIRCYIV